MVTIKTECRVEGGKHICGDPHVGTTQCECTAYCGNDEDEKICHHFDSRTKGCNNKFAWPEYIDMNYFKAREEIGKKRWNNCVKSDGKHLCRDETGEGCDYSMLAYGIEVCAYAMIDDNDGAPLIVCNDERAKEEAEDWTEYSYSCRNGTKDADVLEKALNIINKMPDGQKRYAEEFGKNLDISGQEDMPVGLYIPSHDDAYIADATVIKRDVNWDEYPKLADIFYNRPCKNLLWLELAHLVRSLQKNK